MNSFKLPVQKVQMLSMPVPKPNVSPNRTREIGVVVIGRNEGARLARSLAAAKSQCEQVVYADSASIDGSLELARSLKVIVISLEADVPLTAARGRRAGLEQLLRSFPKCRLVQFLDGDCILHPDWLSEAMSFLDGRPNLAVVCGRRYEASPADSFYNQLIDEEWDSAVGSSDTCGGDALMRIEALRSVGSFRGDLLAGEEPELCNRLRTAGWEIWRIDAPMTEHDAKIVRLQQWLRRAVRSGFGYAQVWGATRHTSDPLYQRHIASALFWVILLPLVTTVSAAVAREWWLLLLLPAAHLLQIFRLAVRRRSRAGFSFAAKAAALTMLSKFAETAGVLSFWFGSAGGQATTYRDVPDRATTSNSA